MNALWESRPGNCCVHQPNYSQAKTENFIEAADVWATLPPRMSLPVSVSHTSFLFSFAQTLSPTLPSSCSSSATVELWNSSCCCWHSSHSAVWQWCSSCCWAATEQLSKARPAQAVHLRNPAGPTLEKVGGELEDDWRQGCCLQPGGQKLLWFQNHISNKQRLCYNSTTVLGTQIRSCLLLMNQLPSTGQGGDTQLHRNQVKTWELNSDPERGKVSLTVAQGGKCGSSKEYRFVHKYECYWVCTYFTCL